MTEAAAEAPATDAVVSAPDAEVLTEDQLLDAAFDRMQDEPDEDAGEEESIEAEEQQDDPQATTEAEAEPEPDPKPQADTSQLPRALRDVWHDVPEAAQQAFIDNQRDVSRRLGEQGRLIQALTPIQDVLSTAVKDLPSMANMRPEQVASEVMELARVSHAFNANPVETLMGLVQQHNLQEAMTQALSGQDVTASATQNNALQNEIKLLKGQLAQVTDPNYLRTQVQAFTTESQTEAAVTEFAAQAEHWSDVEHHLAVTIPLVQAKLGDGASEKDVLSAAYDLAVSQFLPDAQKADPKLAAAKVATDPPEKAEAAKKAKSINVASKPSGKSKAMTLDEALDDAWRRMESQ